MIVNEPIDQHRNLERKREKKRPWSMSDVDAYTSGGIEKGHTIRGFIQKRGDIFPLRQEIFVCFHFVGYVNIELAKRLYYCDI